MGVVGADFDVVVLSSLRGERVGGGAGLVIVVGLIFR